MTPHDGWMEGSLLLRLKKRSTSWLGWRDNESKYPAVPNWFQCPPSTCTAIPRIVSSPVRPPTMQLPTLHTPTPRVPRRETKGRKKKTDKFSLEVSIQMHILNEIKTCGKKMWRIDFQLTPPTFLLHNWFVAVINGPRYLALRSSKLSLRVCVCVCAMRLHPSWNVLKIYNNYCSFTVQSNQKVRAIFCPQN